MLIAFIISIVLALIAAIFGLPFLISFIVIQILMIPAYLLELFVFSGHDTRKYDYDSDVYITNIYKNETRILDNRSVHVEFHNDEKAEKENKKENDMKEIPWHCKK